MALIANYMTNKHTIDMKGRYIRYILVVFASLFFVTSCSKGERYNEPPEVANLTLIFYMGGDNNGLSGETFEKIRKIANINMEALRNEDANIFIYQDHSNDDGRPTLWRVKHSKSAIKNDNTTPFYELTTLEIIEQYDEQNSASWETLRDVIDRCIGLGRAEHYGLWAFSHGSGWLPTGTLSNPRAPSADYIIAPNTIIQDGNQHMELADFAKAIPDKTFDFILFESCLTGGIEVAYELRNKSDYLVVSPTKMLVPGYLDVYDGVLPALFKPWENSDPAENLRAAAQIYFNHWNGQNLESHRSATISVIKTEKLEELAAVVKDISRSGNTLTEDEMLTIQQFDRYNPNLYFDLGHYFSTLATTDAQRSQLNAAIDNVTSVYKKATPWFFAGSIGAFEIKHYSGMTTYVQQGRYPLLDEDYKKLEWTKAITTP